MGVTFPWAEAEYVLPVVPHLGAGERHGGERRRALIVEGGPGGLRVNGVDSFAAFLRTRTTFPGGNLCAISGGSIPVRVGDEVAYGDCLLIGLDSLDCLQSPLCRPGVVVPQGILHFGDGIHVCLPIGGIDLIVLEYMLPPHQGTTAILSSFPNRIGRPGHSLHDLCFAAISRICAAQFKGDGGIAQNLTVFRRQLEELLHRQIALDAVIHVVHQEVAVGDLADGVIDQILVRLALAPVNRGFFQTVGVQAALLVILGQRYRLCYVGKLGILFPLRPIFIHNVFAQVLERKLIGAGLPLRRPVGHGEGGHIRPAVRPAVGRGVRIVCGFQGLRGCIVVPGAGLPAGGNVIRQTALQREGHVRQILPGKAAGQGGPQLLPHQGHVILNGIGEGAAGAQGVVVALAIAVWGTGHAIQAQHIACFNIRMVGFRSGVGISPHGVRFSQAVAHIICCVGAPSGGAVVLCSAVQDGKLLPGAELDLSAIHRHGGILHDLVVEAGGVHRGALHGVVLDLIAPAVILGQAGDGGCPDIAVVRIRLPQVVRDDQLGSGLPGIIRPCVYHPVNIQVDIRAQAIGIVILILPHLVPTGFLGAGEAVGGGNGLGVVRLVAVVGCIFPLGDSPPPLGEDRRDCGRIVSLVHHVGFGQICRAAGYIHQHLLHGVAHNGARGVVLGQVPEVVFRVVYTIRGEGNDLNGGGGVVMVV